MKKYLQILISGIISGIFIGIGVTVYLSILETSKLVGSILFGFGLYSVILWKVFLYTGKVGLVLDNKPKYLLDLLIGLIGNFIGMIALCSIIKLTRYGENLSLVASSLVSTKMNDSWYSIFILSIFCGFMIYLAVKGHAITENPFGRVLICFLAVIIFILCGFEHCVANAGYFVYAGIFSWKAFGYFILMILGNGIGSIALDGLIKLCNYLKK